MFLMFPDLSSQLGEYSVIIFVRHYQIKMSNFRIWEQFPPLCDLIMNRIIRSKPHNRLTDTDTLRKILILIFKMIKTVVMMSQLVFFKNIST